MVARDIVGNGPGELPVVGPVTTTQYRSRSEVKIKTGDSGSEDVSSAGADHIGAVSTARIRT